MTDSERIETLERAVADLTPRCCYIPCDRPAAFVIYERGTDAEHRPADNFTHACEQHVGALLGTVGKPVGPVSWVVTPVEPPAPPAKSEREASPGRSPQTST